MSTDFITNSAIDDHSYIDEKMLQIELAKEATTGPNFAVCKVL